VYFIKNRTRGERKMNWLMYIGGGFLYGSILWAMYVIFLDKKEQELSANDVMFHISIISTWIWICWKFIG